MCLILPERTGWVYIYIKIRMYTKRFAFFKFIFFLHTCYIYIYICFQLVAFVSEHMWHKALLMDYSMRLELTLVSSLNDLWLIRWVSHKRACMHTQLWTYQISKRVKQTKVNTLQERGRMTPIETRLTNQISFKLETRVSSSLIEYPINKASCYICSLTKAISWKYTYITRM